jgi:hypothetical protein
VTVSNNLKILFKNFFINSLKLGRSKGINYPNTCKVVTIMLLWYVLNDSRRILTKGSNLALSSSLTCSLFYDSPSLYYLIIIEVYFNALFRHCSPNEPSTLPQTSWVFLSLSYCPVFFHFISTPYVISLYSSLVLINTSFFLAP